MALFVKFKEQTDEDLIDLFNSCVTILKFYYKYFEALGIPLDEVSYGRPDYFDEVWGLFGEVSSELKNRKII